MSESPEFRSAKAFQGRHDPPLTLNHTVNSYWEARQPPTRGLGQLRILADPVGGSTAKGRGVAQQKHPLTSGNVGDALRTAALAAQGCKQNDSTPLHSGAARCTASPPGLAPSCQQIATLGAGQAGT